ncbi:MAG TPA: hypothetical protein VFB01_15990 [Burkholderiales bacterium]|nr:hypothetical protein [Burkholderiales bacterium]
MPRGLLPVLALALAACATPYQPRGLLGGYADTQLGENVFRVSFTGNGDTSVERAEDFALLRSAEVALEHGFTHFIVIAEKDQSQYVTHTEPTRSVSRETSTQSGDTTRTRTTTNTSGGQTSVVRQPGTVNTIACFRGKPDLPGIVFDAQFVVNSLTQKYEIVR